MSPAPVSVPLRISAVSQFVPDHSDPKNGRYFFAYRVTIENRGAAPVQLVSRHWVITDANHKVEWLIQKAVRLSNLNSSNIGFQFARIDSQDVAILVLNG